MAARTKPKAEAPEQEVLPPPQSKGALTTVTPKLDQYVHEVLPPVSRDQIARSLPRHIGIEIFERNLYNALMINPALMAYAPALVFREVSKAAGLGLLLDPQLGEAYMIEAYNYKTKHKEPQLRIGYKGMNKLARQSGNVAGLWAHEIHELDKVVVDLGHPKVFSHRPVLFGERGRIVGYAAVISYKDGTFDFEPMSVEQCISIRNRSDAWKAYEQKLIKSTPWATDEAEMSKKTVFRRLMKRQDQSPEMRAAIEIEDRAEFPNMVQHEPLEQLRAPAPPPDDLGDMPEETEQMPDRSERAPSKPRGPRGDAPPAESESPAPPEEKQPDKPAAPPAQKLPTLKPEELFAKVQAMVDGVSQQMVDEDADVFNNLWEEKIVPLIADAFPPDVSEVQAIFNKAVRKFAP